MTELSSHTTLAKAVYSAKRKKKAGETIVIKGKNVYLVRFSKRIQKQIK